MSDKDSGCSWVWQCSRGQEGRGAWNESLKERMNYDSVCTSAPCFSLIGLQVKIWRLNFQKKVAIITWPLSMSNNIYS